MGGTSLSISDEYQEGDISGQKWSIDLVFISTLVDV